MDIEQRSAGTMKLLLGLLFLSSVAQAETKCVKEAGGLVLVSCPVLISESAEISSGTIPSFSVIGTTISNNAPVGAIGEYVSSAFSAVATPASTVWGDATSISLTAGDWDVSYVVEFYASTYSSIIAAVGTASGTTLTGVAAGNITVLSVSTTDSSLSLSGYRVSIGATTTHYLKINATLSGGAPKVDGRFSARRVR